MFTARVNFNRESEYFFGDPVWDWKDVYIGEQRMGYEDEIKAEIKMKTSRIIRDRLGWSSSMDISS